MKSSKLFLMICFFMLLVLTSNSGKLNAVEEEPGGDCEPYYFGDVLEPFVLHARDDQSGNLLVGDETYKCKKVCEMTCNLVFMEQ